jgi:hypothetical protein
MFVPELLTCILHLPWYERFFSESMELLVWVYFMSEKISESKCHAACQLILLRRWTTEIACYHLNILTESFLNEGPAWKLLRRWSIKYVPFVIAAALVMYLRSLKELPHSFCVSPIRIYSLLFQYSGRFATKKFAAFLMWPFYISVHLRHFISNASSRNTVKIQKIVTHLELYCIYVISNRGNSK